MKQVWIFLAINFIWVIFCIFLFIKVIPPPSNADTSNKNPSPEYIEMLKRYKRPTSTIEYKQRNKFVV